MACPRVLLVPSLNAGFNFHNHTGDLQRSSGRILKLDEKSLYVGGGSEVYAASPAEVPMINLYSRLTEALFEPHHRFAVSGETEVAWLDDPSVHRSDGNLVNALALGR